MKWSSRASVVVASLLVLGLLVATFAACAKPAPEPGKSAPAPAVKAVKLRYSGAYAPNHVVNTVMKYFAESVQKKTNGAVTVETYPGGELYDHSQVIDAVMTGAIDLGYTPLARWSGRSPVYGFYSYIYMLESADHFQKAADKLRGAFFPLFEKAGIKPIHWFVSSEQACGSSKSIVMPADIKGLMIRGGANETVVVLKRLGAVPAQIASGEEYDALAKGSIDGTFSSWDSIASRKMYEVAKYFTGPFGAIPVIAMMSPVTWGKLDKTTQDAIMAAAKDAEEYSFKQSKDADNKVIETLKAKGTVTILSGDQKAAWVKAVLPAYDQWLQDCEKKGDGSVAKQILEICNSTR